MSLFRRLGQAQRERKTEKRVSRAELRLQKDIDELTFSRATLEGVNSRIDFQASTKLNFTCTVLPSSGPYNDGIFVFEFKIPEEYPFCPPRVRCQTKIFHPNICSQSGHVALRVITKDCWKPVFTINKVIDSIQKLFLKPNLEYQVNTICTRLLQTDPGKFRQMVSDTMRGGSFFGQHWKPNIRQRGAANGKKRGRATLPETMDRRIKTNRTSDQLDTSSSNHNFGMGRNLLSQGVTGLKRYAPDCRVTDQDLKKVTSRGDEIKIQSMKRRKYVQVPRKREIVPDAKDEDFFSESLGNNASRTIDSMMECAS